MDQYDKETRSRVMAAVRSANTKPEILLRSLIHRMGLRYRLHPKDLPGRPDLVFPRYHAVIFVHGCYWHRHGCYKSTMPDTRTAFWNAKFSANLARDQRQIQALLEKQWRVMIVWECALVGKEALGGEKIGKMVRAWLTGSDERGEIPGGLFASLYTTERDLPEESFQQP